MANSNRVFVSPGVYTSETDLTFVAQSVGVTTLGLVGETLKGPAFEPVLITNFDEFKTYFGGTSPLKDANNNPKYELPYFAKSYLQESNQLFVTRILGLTGYKPNKTFGIKTLGGVTFNATEIPVTSGGTMIPTVTGVTGSTFYTDLSGKTATTGDSVPTFIVNGTYGEGDWFTIGLVPTGSTTTLTGSTITGPIGDTTGPAWYNKYFHETGNVVDGLYSYLFVYSGSTFVVTRFNYTGATVNQYDNIVAVALRSRGAYERNVAGPVLSLTSSTGVTISSTTIEENPLGEFTLQTISDSGVTKTFVCSLDHSSTHYITKVLGSDVFDKNQTNYPLYIFESYPHLISALNARGLIRGLSVDVVVNSEGDNFLTKWSTAISPTVVSEVRGGKVSDLFQVVTISDGEGSNLQVKVSVLNINVDTGEFDVVVRDYNDTDDNMSILEKYTRCSMDPNSTGYVALKIGTSDGEYQLNSRYIMLSMTPNCPTDTIPSGFKGFDASLLNNDSELGNVIYKTKYYNAGDIVRYDASGNGIQEVGDKIRKVTLGLSSSVGYDNDLFKFKGLSANKLTTGFHLSVNAATITGNTITGFEFDTTPYDFEGQSGENNMLTTLANRKFTFAVCSGFDGWDIYRDVRTFDDSNIFGKTSYTSHNTDNGGVFSTSSGNSDYYSYLMGIQKFANPEAVDINVFATAGINFSDHASLTSQAIDMIETDRADSLYIIASKNSTNVDPTLFATVDDVINDLDVSPIDSNYSAVYWPWIQVKDIDNSTQLYLPPTGEVLKNIALTDNVSYPWFAIAGYSRGLVNAVKASKKLTLDERDSLYKNRINPIATFSDTGTIIWGNKTLQIRESALDRINVRRLLLRARKLISAVAVRLLFDQNDDQVRNEFSRLVNPILESIKKERGLYDFRVVVSNSPEDIDQNLLSGKIYIKPTRSLEFIDIEFIITPTGASFENV